MTDALFILLWFGVRCLGIDQHACLRQIPALPVTVQGYVTPYAPGVAEAVMRRRIRWFGLEPRWGHVPRCKAALNDNHVGEYAVVFHDRSWSLCWVMDCAQPAHAIERKMHSLVLEVDSESYAEIGRGPVVVSVLVE